jgi:hypothetical protein
LGEGLIDDPQQEDKKKGLKYVLFHILISLFLINYLSQNNFWAYLP